MYFSRSSLFHEAIVSSIYILCFPLLLCSSPRHTVHSYPIRTPGSCWLRECTSRMLPEQVSSPDRHGSLLRTAHSEQFFCLTRRNGCSNSNAISRPLRRRQPEKEPLWRVMQRKLWRQKKKNHSTRKGRNGSRYHPSLKGCAFPSFRYRLPPIS